MKQILFGILFFAYVEGFAQLDTTTNLSDNDKIYGLSLFWKEASYNFAYFDKTNINWDSTYKAFIPQVLATRNTFEYYRVLQRFAALLKDGHTDVQYPWSLFRKSTNTQIHFDYIEGKVLVQNIIAEDSALVPFGSQVIAVNNIPIDKYFETEIFPFISASTDHWRYRRAINMLYPMGDTSKTIILQLRTPINNIVNYSTRLTTKNKRMAYTDRLPKFTQFQELPNGIVYLNLYTFRDTSAITEFKKFLPQLIKAKGVILDLRVNGGGNSDVGVEILKYFTEQKKITTSAGKTLNHIAAFKAWGKYFDLKDTLNDPSRKDLYIKSYYVARSNYWYELKPEVFKNELSGPKIKAPLVILIGNETASAAEDFLVAVDDLKGRATTVGEKTEGSTGQPLPFEMPGGGMARICTLKETYPDGREFVGYGISPNVEVKRTIADFMQGKDPALEKAIGILKTKMK